MIKLRYVATVLAIGALGAGPALAQNGTGYNGQMGYNGQQNYNGEQGQQGYNGQQNFNNTANGLAELTPDTVAQLQSRLQRMGFYHGNIDGQWGPETSDALADFQHAHGLQTTGNLNLPTIRGLAMLEGQGGNNQGSNQGYNQGMNNNGPNQAYNQGKSRLQSGHEQPQPGI